MNEAALWARFEALAFQRYLDLTALAGEEGESVEVMPPAALFWLKADGTYGVHAINPAWWGFRAGYAEGHETPTTPR